MTPSFTTTGRKGIAISSLLPKISLVGLYRWKYPATSPTVTTMRPTQKIQ